MCVFPSHVRVGLGTRSRPRVGPSNAACGKCARAVRNVKPMMFHRILKIGQDARATKAVPSRFVKLLGKRHERRRKKNMVLMLGAAAPRFQKKTAFKMSLGACTEQLVHPRGRPGTHINRSWPRPPWAFLWPGACAADVVAKGAGKTYPSWPSYWTLRGACWTPSGAN